MFLNTIIWLSFGFVAFLMNRMVAFEVEKIFEKQISFFDKMFLKEHFHKVLFGPIYFISSLFRIFLNLDIFKRAKETRDYQKQQQEKIKELSDSMMVFNSTMSKLYEDMLLFSINSNIKKNNNLDSFNKIQEEGLNKDSSEDLNEIIKDVEDILGKNNEDEESK